MAAMTNPRERKTPFDKKELEHFKKLLLKNRAEAQEKFDRLRGLQSNLLRQMMPTFLR